jgi:hypothetical protein
VLSVGLSEQQVAGFLGQLTRSSGDAS